jgi:Flp pilus assembly protein TadG
MRSFLRQEHGNALVELAVAIPILILIAVGVADYSRLYFTEITVANAARSGADWGIKAKGNVDSMAFGARMEAGRDSVGMIITAGVSAPARVSLGPQTAPARAARTGRRERSTRSRSPNQCDSSSAMWAAPTRS